MPCLKDDSHRCFGNIVTYVGQCALDAVVAPSGILVGKLQDQHCNFLRYPCSSRGFAPLAVIPLRCHKLSMPPQDRIWRYDSSHLEQCLSAKEFAPNGQASALIVTKQNAFLAKFLVPCVVKKNAQFQLLLLLERLL